MAHQSVNECLPRDATHTHIIDLFRHGRRACSHSLDARRQELCVLCRLRRTWRFVENHPNDSKYHELLAGAKVAHYSSKHLHNRIADQPDFSELAFVFRTFIRVNLYQNKAISTRPFERRFSSSTKKCPWTKTCAKIWLEPQPFAL